MTRAIAFNPNEVDPLPIRIHVDGASGGMIAPFLEPDLKWDFRLENVWSISTSGHKYGLVYPGVGWVIWRSKEALPSWHQPRRVQSSHLGRRYENPVFAFEQLLTASVAL